MQCFELSCGPAPGATPRVLDSSKFIGDGFYGIENGAPRPWRWAQKRATVHLPPIESAAQLTLTMHVPEHSDGSRTPVKVGVGGKVIDTFQPPPAVFTKSYRIPGFMPDSPIDLILSTERAADVPTDARELAMQVLAVAWTPVAQKPQ